VFRARVLARTLLYVFLVTSTFFRWFFRITYRTTLNVFVYTSYGSTRTVHVHVHYCRAYVYFRRKYEDKYGNNIDNFYVYVYMYTYT
jgi:hypothetical protein